jgi:hypothetical protein
MTWAQSVFVVGTLSLPVLFGTSVIDLHAAPPAPPTDCRCPGWGRWVPPVLPAPGQPFNQGSPRRPS